MATEFASHRVLLTERVPDKLTWIIMPTKERDIEGLTYLEYIEPFQQMKFGRIIRYGFTPIITSTDFVYDV